MSISKDKKFSEEKRKRRYLSPEKKYQIFLESQRGESPVGEILRREGIYSTDLTRIRNKVGGFPLSASCLLIAGAINNGAKSRSLCFNRLLHKPVEK